jgi:tRNA threonylcarbamoyladenosine biosynthesis protein TsaB
VGLREADAPNVHSEKMTRLIEQCLADGGLELGDLDAVAVSAGPGSYTALRVGAATAKAICYALNKPLIGVETLRSLAWGMAEAFGDSDALYCPMIDARRMEVYTAIYDGALNERMPVQAMVIEEGAFKEWMAPGAVLVFAGDGAPKCEDVLSGPNSRFISVPVSARNMVALAHEAYDAGRFEDVAYFAPAYLKPPNITQPKQQWWTRY